MGIHHNTRAVRPPFVAGKEVRILGHRVSPWVARLLGLNTLEAERLTLSSVPGVAASYRWTGRVRFKLFGRFPTGWFSEDRLFFER